jgi:hypothetical protein
MTFLPEEVLPFGTPAWFLFAGIALFGRTADLLSTWIATPNLTLEGNPIARRLGWRWGIPVNLVAALALGCQPTLAIAVGTTSFLVAARNLQSAWVMRSMGEWQYRLWMSERLAEAPRGLALGCFLGEAGLTVLPGVALLVFAGDQMLPMGIGLGLVAYSAAVAFFTVLALLRR